jgi:effector-binding domain-containing protein
MWCSRFAATFVVACALGFCAGPLSAQNAQAQDDRTVPKQLQPGDAFGEEVTLPERTIIFMRGKGTWDSAFETLVDAYRQLSAYMDRQGLKASGPAITIYTQTDDRGFTFQAALPIAAAPNDPPRGDIALGRAPAGKAIKFTHRGSFDAMDATYEAITNYLDDKRLEAKDVFVEEYATDILTTPEDRLVVGIFVPLK